MVSMSSSPHERIFLVSIVHLNHEIRKSVLLCQTYNQQHILSLTICHRQVKHVVACIKLRPMFKSKVAVYTVELAAQRIVKLL